MNWLEILRAFFIVVSLYCFGGAIAIFMRTKVKPFLRLKDEVFEKVTFRCYLNPDGTFYGGVSSTNWHDYCIRKRKTSTSIFTWNVKIVETSRFNMLRFVPVLDNGETNEELIKMMGMHGMEFYINFSYIRQREKLKLTFFKGLVKYK
jgi:hypothetical protein